MLRSMQQGFLKLQQSNRDDNTMIHWDCFLFLNTDLDELNVCCTIQFFKEFEHKYKIDGILNNLL